tara:strand:+ start:260730 stop:261089 length:360 start_codon:yes stop_codon:yes gene_type:complete
MKKHLITFVVAFFGLVYTLNAQARPTEVAVGTVLKIGKTASNSFQHIKFPKANIIIKRGGIANFNQMAGTEVVVHEVKQHKERIVVTVKRKDGQRFFGSHHSVTAHLEAALQSGELVIP